jgi:hypothetical protein
MYTITGPVIIGGDGVKGELILDKGGIKYTIVAPDAISSPYTLTLPSSSESQDHVVATTSDGTLYYQRTVPIITTIRYQLNQGLTSGQTVDISGWSTIYSPTDGIYTIESTSSSSSIALSGDGFTMKGGTYHVVMEASVSYSDIHSQLRLYDSTTETSSWGSAGSFRDTTGSSTPSPGSLFLMDIVEVPFNEERFFQAQIKANAGAVFGSGPNFPNENVLLTITVTKLRG